jgi:hypothetical protein
MKIPALGLLTILAAGCGTGGVGKAVRPDDPTAANALGDKPLATAGGGGGAVCSVVPTAVEPLVVDWSSSAQVDLGVAMKNGVALVSYDCKSF